MVNYNLILYKRMSTSSTVQQDLEEAKKLIGETNDRIDKLNQDIAKLVLQIQENETKREDERIADLERERVRIEAEKALAEARKLAEEAKIAALEKLREAQKVEAKKRDAAYEDDLKRLKKEAEEAAKAAAKAAEDERKEKERIREEEKRERERVRKEEDAAREVEKEKKRKEERRRVYVERRNDLQRDIEKIETKIGKVEAREAEIGIEKEGIRQGKQKVENNIKDKFAQLQINEIDIKTLLEYAGEDRGDVIKFKGTKDPVSGEVIILYDNGNRRFIRKDFEQTKDAEYKNEKRIYEVLSKTPSSFEYVPYYFGSEDTPGGGGRLLLEYVAGITSDKLIRRNITDLELELVKQGLKNALTIFKDIHLLNLTLNPKNVFIQMDTNTIKGILLKNFEYSMILKDETFEGPVTIPAAKINKVSVYYPDDFKEALRNKVKYTYKCLLPVDDTDDIDNFSLFVLNNYYKTCSKKTQAGVPIPPVDDFYKEDSRERIYTLVTELQKLGTKDKSFEDEERRLNEEKKKEGLKLKEPRGQMNNLRREYANVVTPVAAPGTAAPSAAAPSAAAPSAAPGAAAPSAAASSAAPSAAPGATAPTQFSIDDCVKIIAAPGAAPAATSGAPAAPRAAPAAPRAAPATTSGVPGATSGVPGAASAATSGAPRAASAATSGAPGAAPVNLINAIKAQDKDKVIESLSVLKQNVDEKDNTGTLPIEYAIESMNEDIIKILHEYLVYTDDITIKYKQKLKKAKEEKVAIETKIKFQEAAKEELTKRSTETHIKRDKVSKRRDGWFRKGTLTPENIQEIKDIDKRIEELIERIRNVDQIITTKGAELKTKEDEIRILEKKLELIDPPENPSPDDTIDVGDCVHIYGGSDTAFYKVVLVRDEGDAQIRKMQGVSEIGPRIWKFISNFVKTECPTTTGGDNTIYRVISSTPTTSVIKKFDGTGRERTENNSVLEKVACPPAPSAAPGPGPSRSKAAPAPSGPGPAPSAPGPLVAKFKLGDCVTLNPDPQLKTEIDVKTQLFLNKITPMVTAIDIITGATDSSNYIEYELTHYKKGKKEEKVRIQEKYLSPAPCPTDFLPYKAPPPEAAASAAPSAAPSANARRREQAAAQESEEEKLRDKEGLKVAITAGFVAGSPMTITERIAKRIERIMEHGEFEPDPTQFPIEELGEYNSFVSRLERSADKVEEYINILRDTGINLIYLLSEDEKKRIVIPRQRLDDNNEDDKKILEALRILGLTETSTESDFTKAYKKFALKGHPNRGGNLKTFQKVGSIKDKLDAFFKKPTSGGSRYGRTRSSRSRRKSVTRKYRKRI